MKTQVHQIVRGFFMLLIAASTIMPCNDANAQKGKGFFSGVKGAFGKTIRIKVKTGKSSNHGNKGWSGHNFVGKGTRGPVIRPAQGPTSRPNITPLMVSRLTNVDSTLGRGPIVKIPKLPTLPQISMDQLATDWFDVGMRYYKDQSYDTAFRFIRTAAEYGDSNAQCMLGRMHYEGTGTDLSYEKAYDCFQNSANSGNAFAHQWLGKMYYEGTSGEQSYEKAYSHYAAAAEKDLQTAHYMLGLMHYNGSGCNQSYELALEHFIKAAERGHKYAQYYAARMFCDGKGTPESCEDAIKWFAKAAAQGLEEAKASIGYCVEGN